MNDAHNELAGTPGRRVTIADLVRVHPGRLERCLCRGAGEIAFVVKDKTHLRPCGRALAAFRGKHALDVMDTIEGARWIAGHEPVSE